LHARRLPSGVASHFPLAVGSRLPLTIFRNWEMGFEAGFQKYESLVSLIFLFICYMLCNIFELLFSDFLMYLNFHAL
ncbi:hypothetical protein VIGAN_06072300, partial [Vigna angularis var. angularis]